MGVGGKGSSARSCPFFVMNKAFGDRMGCAWQTGRARAAPSAHGLVTDPGRAHSPVVRRAHHEGGGGCLVSCIGEPSGERVKCALRSAEEGATHSPVVRRAHHEGG